MSESQQLLEIMSLSNETTEAAVVASSSSPPPHQPSPNSTTENSIAPTLSIPEPIHPTNIEFETESSSQQQQQPQIPDGVSTKTSNRKRVPSLTPAPTTATATIINRKYKLRPAPSTSPNSSSASSGAKTSNEEASLAIGASGVGGLTLISPILTDLANQQSIDDRKDENLPIEDREALVSVTKGNALCVIFSAIGMMFFLALPITFICGVVLFFRIKKQKNAVSGQSQRRISFFAQLVLALSIILSATDFGVGVELVKDYGINVGSKWWGIAMIPGTYPFMIAALILGSIATYKTTDSMRDTAWKAVDYALSQSRLSITRHYSIVHRRVIAASASDSSIDVVICPDFRMREKLVSEAGVSEALLEDALDPVQEARVEFGGGHMAAVIRMAASHLDDYENRSEFHITNCGIFLFANKLVIVLSEARPLFEGRAFERVDSLSDVVIRLMRSITRGFEANLKLINAESERLEDDIDSAQDNRALMENFSLQKSLVYHVNALTSNGAVFLRISERLPLSQRSQVLINEIIIENTQCQKMADLFCTVISGLLDSRASIISNNLNVAMKSLNKLVLAFAVPTFLSGVGGMSEFSGMIGFDKNWKIAYPLFIISCIVISVIVYYILSVTERFWAKPSKSFKKRQKHMN